MRKIIATLTLLLAVFSVAAQENGLNPKLNIEVGSITYEIPKKKTTAGKVLGVIAEAAAGVAVDKHHEDRLPALVAAVKSGVSQVRRFVPVEALMENEAGFLLTATVTGITTVQKTETREITEKGKKKKVVDNYYEAKVGMAITMTHSTTGETYTQNFSTGTSSDGMIATADKALGYAIDRMSGEIVKYFNEAYPLRANIVERGAEKKDKMKELYIDVGSADRVQEDMNFYVYEVSEVAGREIKKEIGRVRVNEILGDDISICRVKKGGKDIKLAFDENRKLLVESSEKVGLFGL